VVHDRLCCVGNFDNHCGRGIDFELLPSISIERILYTQGFYLSLHVPVQGRHCSQRQV
jgi:hypothetical protein